MYNNFKSPWGPEEKKRWFLEQKIQRSYADEVVTKIQDLKSQHEIVNYGALSIDSARYPLFYIKTKNFNASKKTILITGGVHGYETSGVHGALRFMKEECQKYGQFNVLCFPCISPWAYETINRWNNLAIDPNRSFYPNSPSEESANFLGAFDAYKTNVLAHFDLHETTDTDNSIFRPAKASRDGVVDEYSEIPDGFYTVGDTGRPEREFQKAIIDSVRKVTHIAPPDEKGNIIGEPIDQEGVIFYDKRKLFLCGGVTDAKFVTTTEVYPDGPKASPEICIKAQVAAICGGLQMILRHSQA
ncbi:MAG: M14 family metallocarboxypeptidase [Bacteriovoracaceae bacterium]|nr:M14 family metallocarboxypeptidase [Bacteriovoracaceae bacterium]